MDEPDEPIRILYVEDDPAFAEATATFLQRENDRFDVETVPDADEAERRLAEIPVDCVVSDYDMPGRNGIELLESLREDAPELPFILYTGKGNEEVASDAISAGVTDYLQKDVGTGQYTVLANRITNVVSARRSVPNRALRRLYEIAADGTAAHGEKLRRVLELGRIFLDTETAFATKVDRGANSWEVVEVCGDDERLSPGMSASLSETYCRKTIEADEVLTVWDAEAEGWSDDPAFERWGYNTYVSQELRVDGDIYGTLCFADRSVRATPLAEADQTFVNLAAQWVSGEITRHRRERLLERYRRYTDDMLDAVQDVFYVVDREGVVRRWNESLGRVTGYSDAEIAQMHAADFFPDEVTDTVNEAVAELFETGDARVEAPYLTKSGERIPHEFIGVRATDPDGETVLVGIARDITERRKHERKIEALVENTANPIYIKDRDGVYRFVNRATAEYFDREVSEVVGHSDTELLEPEAAEEIRAGDSHVLEQGTPITRETTVEIDGESVVFIDNKFPFRDEAGEMIGVMGISRDITEQKRRERELEHQNERLDQFAAVLSHDLRNPLSVATTHLTLARRECESERLETVERALDQMKTLIDDVLSLARHGQTVESTEAVDLPEIVAAATDNVETEGAVIECETDVTLRADAKRLRRLLENLMRNAVEHGGDAVTIRIDELDRGFYLADDGKGIPEEERARVFETGYTLEGSGTGFGLRIVREIATAHGWTIRATESGEGGARFEITGVERA